jgi:hypothetical protein
VFGLARVGEGLHEVLVAADAAAALGRGGSPPAGAARVAHLRVGFEDGLHLDPVVPVVTEVVVVVDRAVLARGYLLEGDALLGGEVGDVGLGRAEIPVGGLKGVQVPAFPVEGGLDDRV